MDVSIYGAFMYKNIGRPGIAPRLSENESNELARWSTAPQFSPKSKKVFSIKCTTSARKDYFEVMTCIFWYIQTYACAYLFVTKFPKRIKVNYKPMQWGLHQNPQRKILNIKLKLSSKNFTNYSSH